MRNFNIYDPMKRGQGLVLDGQTLAHIEVLLNSIRKVAWLRFVDKVPSVSSGSELDDEVAFTISITARS